MDSSGREWASPYDPQIYHALYHALAVEDQGLNRVRLRARKQPRFQIRSLQRRGDKLYALTSGGNLLEWTWNGDSLVGEKLLVKGTQNDVYFAQTIAEEELVSLGAIRGSQRFDRLSSDSMLQAMQSQGNRVDVVALEPQQQQMLMGRHLPDGRTLRFSRQRPDQPDTLPGHLAELVIAERGGGWRLAICGDTSSPTD